MSFRLVIIGRPNVGKSTLFNRLVGRRLALVDDLPGVTRDRREGEARLGDLAFTAVDTAPYEELRSRLEPLTGNDRPFRHTARELLALSAWRAGDQGASRRWIDLILTDAQTPSSTRARIEMLMALTGGRAKG